MSDSPILAFPLISANQNQKETTANTAFTALEGATQDELAVDLSAGNVTLTKQQFNNYFFLRGQGHSVPRTLTVPSFNVRMFAALNEGSDDLTVKVHSGTSIVVAAGEAAVFYSDTVTLYAITASGLVTGGASEFTDLTDVPASYTGETLKVVRVKADESGLEFATLDSAVENIGFALSDEVTVVTTGAAKVTVRAPFAMTVTGVRASLTTSSSSGVVTVDINVGGSSILSTKLTIDASAKTSVSASTPAVISTPTVVDDAEITFDVDTAGTGATGLKVMLICIRT